MGGGCLVNVLFIFLFLMSSRKHCANFFALDIYIFIELIGVVYLQLESRRVCPGEHWYDPLIVQPRLQAAFDGSTTELLIECWGFLCLGNIAHYIS